MPHIAFTSDSAAIERVLQRLEQQNAKLIAQNRSLARESREASQQFAGSIGSQIEGLGKMAIGVGLVKQAVSLAISEYQRWDQVMSEIGKKAIDQNKSIVRAMTSAGDLAQQSKVVNYLESQKLGTREQGTTAYQAVSGAMSGATLSERLPLITEALRALPLVGSEGLQAHAKLMGDIGGNSKLDPADVSDLVFALREEVGDKSDKLTSDSFQRAAKSLVMKGIVGSEVEAYGLGAAALRSDQDPKVIEKMAAEVGVFKPMRTATAAKGFSPQDEAHNFYYAEERTARQQWKMLMGDESVAAEIAGPNADKDRLDRIRALIPLVGEEVLGGQGSLKRDLFTREQPEQVIERLRTKIAGDHTGDLLKSGPAVTESTFDQQLAVQGDAKRREYEDKAKRVERLRKYYGDDPSVEGRLNQAGLEAGILIDRVAPKRSWLTDALGHLRYANPLLGAVSDAARIKEIGNPVFDPANPLATDAAGRLGVQVSAGDTGLYRAGDWKGAGPLGLHKLEDSASDQVQLLQSIRDAIVQPRGAPVINAHTETR